MISAAQPSGNDALEQSVNKAIAYLEKAQAADGSWQLGQNKSLAASSLAVMAFLSAGHVPGEGKYGAVVMNIMRLGGVVTVFLIIGLLLVLRRRGGRVVTSAARS